MCRCETRASIPLDAIRRPRVTPIWKLEAALKCRSCWTPRYAPPVHMIRLTGVADIADGSKCANIRLNNVFRFALELGHCPMPSALRICANKRHGPMFEMEPVNIEGGMQ